MINIILIMLSVITIIIIGISGYVSFDVKRVIAFSTSSQMGFILVIINIGCNYLGIYLIITLGLNKGLLFLTVGVIILSYNSTQDLRYLRNYNGITLIYILMSNLNLIGYCYTLVYYSKELILTNLDLLLLLGIKYLILFGSILTITYSIRLMLRLI